MRWVIHCDCGTDVTGDTEEEFVEKARAHAKTSHALTMTKEQVLALATKEQRRQAISQHLDVLEAAGLVTTRRDGRYKFHHFDPSPLLAISERWPSQTRKKKQ